VSGSSLSIRLPSLVVWLSFGLRDPDTDPEAGEAHEGFAQLEVALPSRLDNNIGLTGRRQTWHATASES
jgi:hypothetical protein